MKFFAVFVLACTLALASSQLGVIPVGYSTPTASYSLGVPLAYAYAAPVAPVRYQPAQLAVAAIPATLGYLVKK